MDSPLGYWLFCGSFLIALTAHLLASIIILVWCFWREAMLVDWHGRLMLFALGCGVVGALSQYWLFS
ncbi:MAG: hypothetical protein H7Y37_20500 [Anaerolineae bacterium]|nr:hypothetical protein [Gloeobacterales cyanobacterium ES-bin-313]